MTTVNELSVRIFVGRNTLRNALRATLKSSEPYLMGICRLKEECSSVSVMSAETP